MKKYIYLLTISLVVFGLNVHSQKIKVLGSTPAFAFDTTSVFCLYRQLIQEDTLVPNKYAETKMALQIGKRCSKYWDTNKYQLDSIYKTIKKQGLNMNSKTNMSIPRSGRYVPFVVYKNYPEGKLTFEDYVCYQSYRYEEEMPVQAWQLKKDTMTVCGYLCKKAITTFRGRNYVAWYAEAIPIGDGPWKFSGLPGLILKVNDDRNQFSFECTSVEPSINKELIYIVESKFNEYVSRNEYQKIKRQCMDNPAAASAGNPVLTAGGTVLPPEASKKRPYNPMELTD